MRKFREDSIPEKTKKLRNMVYKKIEGLIIKLYALYLEKNRLRRQAIHRCMQNLNYVNKLFFCENKHKEFSKNISG